MKVKLVSYSQIDEDFKQEAIHNWKKNNTGNEPSFASVQDLIAYCAKVSNPTNQINELTSEKLIKYLIANAHWSPLEMVSACIEIETTRDIAHQIVRHSSMRFQEFSQRYAEPSAMGDAFILREARLQDTKNRQNSIDLDMTIPSNLQLHNDWNIKQLEVIELAKEAYEWAIENGIAKEQARVVLPEGNTRTRLYMNGTLRSWVHYIQLRSANGTQKEHMQIAVACAEVIHKIFPLIKDL